MRVLKKCVYSVLVCRYTGDEIEKKVSTFRQMIIDKEVISERVIEKDETGRPM